MVKRGFDVLVSLLGLLALAPLLAVTALLIRLDSPGPVLFRHERVGLGGRRFRVYKFRTMTVDSEAGRQITVGADPRITRLGVVLRRHKLDELPQLFNVIGGSMSLVGPRPEVPRYVDQWPAELRSRILSVRPGITDPASILFHDESELLARYPDPEAAYREIITPAKLQLYARYVGEHSLLGDVGLIFRTLLTLSGGRGHTRTNSPG